MPTYRDEEPLYREDGTRVRTADGRPVDRVVVRRRGGGGLLVGVILILALIIALLFYTGFFSANVTQSGALPRVSVDGGALPKVDLQSKKIVVGSKKETVSVPTVGVKDNKQDGD